MSQFGEVRICGRNDAIPFMNVTRPDLSGACPNGLSPCSKTTGPQSTICYNTTEHLREEICPITDIKFVENDILQSYLQNGYDSR